MTVETERAAKFLAWREKKRPADELDQTTDGDVLDVLEFIEKSERKRGMFGDEG